VIVKKKLYREKLFCVFFNAQKEEVNNLFINLFIFLIKPYVSYLTIEVVIPLFSLVYKELLFDLEFAFGLPNLHKWGLS